MARNDRATPKTRSARGLDELLLLQRKRLAPDDPAYAETERRLAAQPPIRVPTTVLAGADDGVTAVQDEAEVAQHFSGPFRYEVLPGCGHNIPQEAPAAFATAVRERLP